MAKRLKPVHQLTVKQFEELFPHEDTCKAYLQARRWPEGPRCPRCGNPAVYDLPSRKWHWQCEKCTRDGYRFSILVGTIFENTNKPLRDWFRVAHLMLTSKKGMSAFQIMRYMGFGSYKTAWEMCHKIRVALMEDIEKLGGIVEVDETEVGGKDRKRHWDKRDHRRGRGSPKATVVGAVKRKGNVIARVVENVKAPSVSGDPAQRRTSAALTATSLRRLCGKAENRGSARRQERWRSISNASCASWPRGSHPRMLRRWPG